MTNRSDKDDTMLYYYYNRDSRLKINLDEIFKNFILTSNFILVTILIPTLSKIFTFIKGVVKIDFVFLL